VEEIKRNGRGELWGLTFFIIQNSPYLEGFIIYVVIMFSKLKI